MIKDFSLLPAGNKLSWSVIGFIFILSTVLILSTVILSHWIGVSNYSHTERQIPVLNASFYSGVFSQVGVMFWSASVTICFFVAKILSSRAGRAKISNFLFISGLVSLGFCLNDIFIVHEQIITLLLIPKEMVYLGYSAVIMSYLLGCYRIILKTDYSVLAISLVFFVISIFIDLTNGESFNQFLFLGTTKMIGIVSWMVYFFRLGKSTLLPIKIKNPNNMKGLFHEIHHYHYN
jgi:hypothetical protein